MNPNASPPPNDDALREQCTAYLLGDLDAQQAAAFEQRLADARLAELLVAESRLIGGLASEHPWPEPQTIAPAPAPAVAPCTVPPCPAPPAAPLSLSDRTASPSRQAAGFGTVATLLAAIAAVVLVASLLSRHQEHSPSVSPHASRSQPAAPRWQLTDALVDPAIEWADSAEAIASGGVDEEGRWDDVAAPGGEDTATDESLSWLVIAVETAGLGEDNGDG